MRYHSIVRRTHINFKRVTTFKLTYNNQSHKLTAVRANKT